MTGGTEIAGRYRIEGRLGLGGMSTVHLATDTRLERHVAIKLLAEHLADDPTFVSRFQREALSAAKLVHPNVVQVFDSGLDPASGRHFIVMEYVPGQSLAQLLRERPQLDVAETLDIVVQACHGLDYAHRQGVVHRDVKPGNLLITPDGIVKLADFGIAAATDQSSITQVGSVLGTAAYLAPEQAAGEEAGPQADLYSLGVVTYQCLAGRLPYEAASLSELVLKQQREVPPHAGPVARRRRSGARVRGGRRAVDPPAGPLRERAGDGRGARPGRRGHRARGGDRGDELHGRHRGDLGARRPRPGRRHAASAPRRPARAGQPAPGRPRRRARGGRTRSAARGRPSKRRRRRRTLAVLLVLALIGAGVGIAIVTSMSDSQRVQLRRVVYDSVQQSVDAMKQLVSDNTK